MHRSMTILSVLLVVSVGFAALGLVAGQEAEPQPAAYIGEKKCRKCHIKHYKTWKETLHAKTFETLGKKYRDDPACTACHTTGHGAGGFTGNGDSDHLLGVQCEQCHGPGSAHKDLMAQLKKDNVDKENYPKDKKIVLTPTNCATCHNPHTKHPEYEKD